MAESREVAALRQYIKDSGLPHRVTSTTGGTHSKTSRHYQMGTDGKGLAVDFAGPRPNDSLTMTAIFQVFGKIAGELHELIYKGPGVSATVKAGRWGDPLRQYGAATWQAHTNHVHVSVDRGRFVRWPGTRSIPEPARVPVHDYAEAAVKSTMIYVTLDGDGNGWSEWQLNLGRDPIVVGVTLQGPHPPSDGYWLQQKDVTLSAQPRDGKLIVTVRNGKAGDTVGVLASIA
jgi:hypothetical protein